MKNLKFLAPMFTLLLFSCSDYLDVNQSPNSLFYNQVGPDALLPGAQVSIYRVQIGDNSLAGSTNQLGNVWMNSWTRNVQSYGSGFDTELQLNLNSGFYNSIWNTTARQLKNFQTIIDYPNETHKYDYFIAAAKICKAYNMQTICDLYGDAPYSEAWKGVLNLTPKYDDDYAIYKDLIKNCEDARNLIDNADSSIAQDIAPFDVMLGGNMTKWSEFANTVQLRLCLRMSNVTGAKATYRDAKLAAIAGGPFLSDNVKINPGFSGANDDQASPAFNNYAIDAAGSERGNRVFITMTGHAYKSLQSYASTNWAVGESKEIVAGSGLDYANVTDPRSARLFTATPRTSAAAPANARRAVTQGASFVTVGAPLTPAGIPTVFPGLPCRLGVVGNFNQYACAPSGENAELAACPGYIMTYSESEFLQAEAAVRYPALFSGAQIHFNNGVTDNFLMKVAVIGTYLTTINAKPNFGLTASTTLPQKLHAIMYQKWVALMGVNAIQSYIDYVRTGFPITPLSTTATQSRKPYRLIYPASEYTANALNVPIVVTNDCFAINALTPFWVLGAN